jgi:hypothetical protein
MLSIMPEWSGFIIIITAFITARSALRVTHYQ